MTPRALSVLRQLDQLFSDPKPEAQAAAIEVWDVLTALRGPDTGLASVNGAQKNLLTVPIRRAAFPETARGMAGEKNTPWQQEGFKRPLEARAMFSPMGPNMPHYAPVEQEAKLAERVTQFQRVPNADMQRDAHFLGHILRAARVLGI